MRAITMAFSGLLGLATLPGLAQTAQAADRLAAPYFARTSASAVLVGDRDRHHRGYYYRPGWGDRHHGWRDWHHGGRYYPRFYGALRYYRAPSYSYVVPSPRYYVAPAPVYVPPPAYVRPSPPAYYYDSGGFNLGFNLNIYD